MSDDIFDEPMEEELEDDFEDEYDEYDDEEYDDEEYDDEEYDDDDEYEDDDDRIIIDAAAFKELTYEDKLEKCNEHFSGQGLDFTDMSEEELNDYFNVE